MAGSPARGVGTFSLETVGTAVSVERLSRGGDMLRLDERLRKERDGLPLRERLRNARHGLLLRERLQEET